MIIAVTTLFNGNLISWQLVFAFIPSLRCGEAEKTHGIDQKSTQKHKIDLTPRINFLAASLEVSTLVFLVSQLSCEPR